jgi:hypothetical protein
MKRRNRTQQEGPVEPKEIATISMTRIRPETESQKTHVKLVSTREPLFHLLSTPITARSLASGWDRTRSRAPGPIEQLPEAHVVFSNYPLAKLDRLPEELLKLASTTPRRLTFARGLCCRHPDGRPL